MDIDVMVYVSGSSANYITCSHVVTWVMPCSAIAKMTSLGAADTLERPMVEKVDDKQQTLLHLERAGFVHLVGATVQYCVTGSGFTGQVLHTSANSYDEI